MGSRGEEVGRGPPARFTLALLLPLPPSPCLPSSPVPSIRRLVTSNPPCCHAKTLHWYAWGRDGAKAKGAGRRAGRNGVETPPRMRGQRRRASSAGPVPRGAFSGRKAREGRPARPRVGLYRPGSTRWREARAVGAPSGARAGGQSGAPAVAARRRRHLKLEPVWAPARTLPPPQPGRSSPQGIASTGRYARGAASGAGPPHPARERAQGLRPWINTRGRARATARAHTRYPPSAAKRRGLTPIRPSPLAWVGTAT